MIGTVANTWSWRDNVLVPLSVGVLEAVWASAVIGALVHPPTARHVIPIFLALTCCMAASLVTTALTARIFDSTFSFVARLVAITLLAFVGTAIAVAVLSGPVFDATQPSAVRVWSIGASSAPAATAAWLVAIVAWARGILLGWKEPSEEDAQLAIGVALFAWSVEEVLSGFGELSWIHGERLAEGLLFLLALPLALAGLVSITDRVIAYRVLRRVRSWLEPSWLVAVFLPLSALAVGAIALAFAIAPGGSLIGDELRRGAHAFGNLFKNPLHPTAPPKSVRPPPRLRLPLHLPTSGGLPLWFRLIGIILLIIVGLLLLKALFQVRIGGFRRVRRVLNRTGRALRSVMVFNRTRRPQPPDPVEADPGLSVSAGSVRWHYRRFLVQARDSGLGRTTSETASELEDRLTLSGIATGPPTLAQLTELYQSTRYGGLEADSEQLESARTMTEIAIADLRDRFDVTEQEPEADPA